MFQGHVVIGTRVGHGRQELVGRRRHHQDPVSPRQQPHHPRRRDLRRVGIRIGVSGFEPREVGDEQQQRRKSIESRSAARRLKTTFVCVTGVAVRHCASLCVASGLSLDKELCLSKTCYKIVTKSKQSEVAKVIRK